MKVLRHLNTINAMQCPFFCVKAHNVGKAVLDVMWVSPPVMFGEVSQWDEEKQTYDLNFRRCRLVLLSSQ